MQTICEATKRSEVANKIPYGKQLINFVKEGNSRGITFLNKYNSSLFDECTDWNVDVELERRLAFLAEL